MDHIGYGAWLNHSGFAVQRETVEFGGTSFRAWYNLAGGDLTGSRPSVGSADLTYSGVMVGTMASGAGEGDFLRGDARLTFDGTDHQIDASFTGIRNVADDSPASVGDVTFSDVPVTDSGTWSQGSGPRAIRGAFYGPDHAEASGVFEASGIIGVYGTRKQTQ